MNEVASTEKIRSHFPALERNHGGHKVAYFDGPGGTQVPWQVADAVSDYLLHHNANTHWAFPTSIETDAKIAEARAALADFLGASPREIVLANNMTTGAFHLARALGRGWGPGDEIVITELDHHANVAPWQALAKERGISLRRVKVNLETGQLDGPSLEAALNPKTRLLAIGAASNALGTVSDVAAAGQLAHQVGAKVFVDAVHYAPHELVDVAALDCDFLACSVYKFYGPHVGVLYGRAALLDELDVPKLEPAPEKAPERLETGTQNHEGIVGAGAAVDFLASLGSGATRREKLENVFAALHQRGKSLFHRLWEGLGEIPGLQRYGPSPGAPRTPTVSFTVRGVESGRIARGLAERGIFVSHGDFYATTVVNLLGQAENGLVRAGAACYTTEREIDRLVAGVAEIVKE